jgi:hypothetical protein
VPVLFNKATGLHENLTNDAAQAALANKTHEVPLVSPDGDFGSAPASDAAELVKAGHRQPTPQELQQKLDQGKYGTGTEQLKTAAEGALEASTFGIGNAVESAMLGNSKEQLKRREVNELSNQVGQGVGLVGSALTGVGEGAALEQLGAKLTPKATTALGRVGSAATKAAIENMAFQADDDATKAYMGDPNVTATHFVQDVGMSGLLGAALGGAGKGAGELWSMGPGKQLAGILDKLKGRTEPTAAQRFEAVGQDLAAQMNGATAALGNQNAENLQTATQAGLDNTAQVGAGTTNAVNGLGQTVVDAANTTADNQGAIGNATIDAINQQGSATVDAINNLARQQNQTLSLADQLKVGSLESETANVNALKLMGQQGVEGVSPELQAAAGVEIPDSLKAALGDNPDTRMKHSLLQSGTSKAAQSVQQDVQNFKTSLRNAATEALGYTDEDVAHINNVSENQVGKEAAAGLQQHFKDIIETGSEGFDKFHEVAKDVKLDQQAQLDMANRLVDLSTSEGWAKSPSSPEAQLLKRVLTELPLQDTASDIAKYATIINNETQRAEMWHAGTMLRQVFREEADNVIQRHLEGTAGQAVVAEFAAVRKQYGALMNFLEEYGQRLGVRSFSGPTEFMSKLADVAKNPEKLLGKLSAEGDENLSNMLAQQMPSVYKTVNEYNKANLVKAALTADRKEIDVLKLGKAIDKMSPEFRNRVLPEGSANRIGAVESLQRAIPEPQNKSGSGAYIMNAIQNMSPSAVGMGATMLTGPVGGAASFVLKKMADYVGKEAPDAITLATLKTLGSNMGTNPAGFKAAAQMASAVIKGETMLNKAAKAVFSAGTKVISEPSDKDIKKLAEHVDTAMLQPEKLLNVGGDVGHYMPEAGAALGETSQRVVQYLASLRPNEEPLGVLGGNRVPSKAEKSAYNRALRIAEQPLVVMNDIKNGMLSPHDLQHMQAMYPDMHAKIASKLMNELIGAKASKKSVPYSTRMGLSNFLGQPLDSSLHQQSIAANQMALIANNAKGGSPGMGMQKPARQNPKMQTVAQAFATPQQRLMSGKHGQ